MGCSNNLLRAAVPSQACHIQTAFRVFRPVIHAGQNMTVYVDHTNSLRQPQQKLPHISGYFLSAIQK